MAINKINNGDSGSVVRAIINAVIDAVNGFISGKVDTVPGKGLSTNDYTNEDRQKVADALTELNVSDITSRVTNLENGLENFVDTTKLAEELSKKVTIVAGQRLITTEEAIKINESVSATELDLALDSKVGNDTLITTLGDYSLKDTTTLTEILEGTTLPDYFIVFNEETKESKKISIAKLLEVAANGTYPKPRLLLGEKNGTNTVFSSGYTYIEGSEKLNINGSIYYPNSGFYYEGGNIILSGAPTPEAGDFMYLEAIYTN